MIYTLTLNPAIDYLINIEQINLGEINRINKGEFFAGGKGVNVSRILQRLQIENVATGFVGGFSGSFIKSVLSKENIKHSFVEIANNTRINIKIKSQKETEINGSTLILEEEKQQLFDFLENLQKDDLVVIAGSSPVGNQIYLDIIEKIKAKQAKFVIDIEGEILLKSLEFQPEFIKPNVNELAQIFKIEIKTQEDILFYGQKLLALGAKKVLISAGSKGAYLITNDKFYFAKPLQYQLINSVGAGDSMVAGFIAGLSQELNDGISFQLAVACGSATAFSEDLASFELIEKLQKEVEINKSFQ